MVKIEQTGGRLTEEEILHGKEDAYGIYQVNRKGAGRDYAFLSFDSLRSKGKVPERTEYQLVYSDIFSSNCKRSVFFSVCHIFLFCSISFTRLCIFSSLSFINSSFAAKEF